MKILRTPDERFVDLPGYTFAPNYSNVDGLRIHYVDEGARDAPTVLMLHGEPTWSYLYRKMIPPLVTAGCRAVAPDFIGFGRSDKPSAIEDYTFQRHVDWMTEWLVGLNLTDVTLFCQDWGSLIGLRLVAENPNRFARVMVSNGGLPTGDQRMPDAFFAWKQFAQTAPDLPVGAIVRRASLVPMSDDVMAAYDAPFPDESYKAGARAFPALVPATPDDPAAPANRAAWGQLMRWEKPFLTAFSDSDPITAGGDAPLRKLIPGAHGQPHVTVSGAGHFVQEDRGEELANVLIDFMRR